MVRKTQTTKKKQEAGRRVYFWLEIKGQEMEKVIII